jgi:hypothetical protein
MKLISYNSHVSTRRPNEFTTWFRYSTTIGVCKLSNRGWMETTELISNGTEIELPDDAVRFQPESFMGSKGELVTMSHIVAR